MRKTVIDGTPVNARMKGLGYVLRGLLDVLNRNRPSFLRKVFVDESYAAAARERWPHLPLEAVRSKPAIAWEQWILPRRLADGSAVRHFTGRDRVAPSLASRTTMYLFEIPDYRIEAARRSGTGLYGRLSDAYNLLNFKRVAGEIAMFVVSSVSTARDLVDRYGVSEERIRLVYPGIEESFFVPPPPEARDAARRAFAEGRPYVLHFCTGDPRENSATALKAFAQACPRIPGDIVLLVVGVEGDHAQWLDREVDALGIAGRTLTVPFLSEEDLIAVYRGAAAYLDPTRYEGFGRQILEAMACGVPVISSRVTSVPEVAGDAAILLDPYDTEGFAESLVRVLRDSSLADEMRKRGLANVQRFRWQRAAEELLPILSA